LIERNFFASTEKVYGAEIQVFESLRRFETSGSLYLSEFPQP